jgi:glycogen debranching enzyme
MQHNEIMSDLAPLGMSLLDGGGIFSVWSESAEKISLHILDPQDTASSLHEIALERSAGGIWTIGDDRLQRGIRYMLRASGPEGPRHAFQPERNLLDPYAKGLVRENPKDYHCVAIETEFDWQGVTKPGTSLSESVIYEAHVRGFTRINPAIPEAIRGSYAALGHPATIEYLQNLGITAIELLPIHAFISEPRLVNLGLINYWGYNSINFFTPHMRYAAESTRAQGPEAILAELKTAIRELHRAGIEVILDVVYNHTAEGGHKGLTYSYRGLDNSNYYRQDDHGNYHDTTGCGNSLNFGNPIVQKLTLDSLRYWTQELQVDGFRFDLAATIARDESNHFNPDHPLLQAMQQDPVISKAKLIVEPWDVGMGGWQTGNFPAGFPEWNDRYRDAVRKFWVSDIAHARNTGSHQNGVQELAGRLSGSQDVIAEDTPLGGINFVTAHDGFTLRDLVSYSVKHNSANGEGNRDGSNHDHSFNHGFEGETPNTSINYTRRKAARNLMGTLLLSAGTPMITAGDERLKTQSGNNNAYCQDNVITWQSWEPDSHSKDFEATVAHLIEIRKKYRVLRPTAYTHGLEPNSEADQMIWYSASGHEMSIDDWHNPERRTLQRLSYHLLEDGSKQGMLLVINGQEKIKSVTLPKHPDIASLELLWDSSLELPPKRTVLLNPGSKLRMVEASMQLFLVR